MPDDTWMRRRTALQTTGGAGGGPRRILILSSEGEDRVFYYSTLPALAQALRSRGGIVEIVSPWSSRWDSRALPCEPEDLRFRKRWKEVVPAAKPYKIPLRALWGAFRRGRVPVSAYVPDWAGTSGVETWLEKHGLSGFDLVITSDFPTAQCALASGSLDAAARIVVVDFHLLKGMDDAVASWLAPSARAAEGGWWPSKQLILESAFPAHVQLYRSYGVPPEHVAWRPFALHPGHFPPGPPAHECRLIMSGGNHLRDLETLRAATERLPHAVHPVVLLAPGERLSGNAHLRHEGTLPLRSFYHVVANSRFVVLPLREEANHAAGITVLAMALMAGRPLVVTGTAAVRDYVRHGAEALLVPPGDPAALADAITRLDSDPALLSTLSTGARQAGQRLSTEHWADQAMSGGAALGPAWPPGG